MYGRGKKLNKPKTQKRSAAKITECIKNVFILKKWNKEIKEN